MISQKNEKLLRKMLSLATEPDEALSYEALCGFLFGLAMTPEVVRPSEWLPLVFGEEMITLDSEEEGQRLLTALMQVVNDLTARFHNGTLHFPFTKNFLANEVKIEPVGEWTFGLNEALLLRPDCWFQEDDASAQISEEQEEVLTALSVIHAIAEPEEVGEIFETEYEEAEDRGERLLATLFAMLPTAVESLLIHAEAREVERQKLLGHRRDHGSFRHESQKIGRNDPCPCGSGKKYKKCCLRKEKIVPIH